MDREAWWAIAHGVTKESDTTEHTCTQTNINLIEAAKQTGPSLWGRNRARWQWPFRKETDTRGTHPKLDP